MHILDDRFILADGDRFNIIEDPNFTMIGELKPTGAALFIHCTPIKEWSHTRYKECLLAVATIKKAAKQEGFNMIYCLVPEERQKFVTRFGFKILKTYRTANGQVLLFGGQET